MNIVQMRSKSVQARPTKLLSKRKIRFSRLDLLHREFSPVPLSQKPISRRFRSTHKPKKRGILLERRKIRAQFRGGAPRRGDDIYGLNKPLRYGKQ
jgi:hypothetical protein